MQTRGRFVKNEELAGTAAGGAQTGSKMTGQLEALPLAARECRQGLSERQIAESDGPQMAESGRDVRVGGKEFPGFLDRQIQDVGDAVVAVVGQAEPDGQRRIGIAFAAAFGTGQVYVGKELHFDVFGS